MMLYSLLALAGLASATEHTLSNGQSIKLGDPTEFPGAIEVASNDIIVLGAGTVFLYDVLQFGDATNITIRGTPDPIDATKSLTTIKYNWTAPAANAEAVPVITSSILGGITIEHVNFEDMNAASACSFGLPLALQANMSLALLPSPVIQENKVKIKADLGPWYWTRRTTEFSYGTCKWSAVAGTAETDTIQGSGFSLNTKCHATFEFSARFDKTQNCGGIKETYPTLVSYKLALEASYTENVEYVSGTRRLRVPAVRNGNAITNLRLAIDRVGNVTASITVNYPEADLQAAITAVSVNKTNNITTVSIAVTLPYPYTVNGPAGGLTTVTDKVDSSLTAGNWSAGTSCNNATDSICTVMLQLQVTACQLTASYDLLDLPVGCQAVASSNNVCPTISQDTTDVRFYLDSKDFCKVTEVNISDVFIPTITLRTDNTFLVDRPTSAFNLGEMSFWSIKLWTNTTGVVIRSADIINSLRTSDGDCAAYPPYLTDATLMNDVFSASVEPREIQFSLPVTAQMACASATSSSNQVNFTYTVRVDYEDGSRRRRRDSEFLHKVERRKTGDLDVGKDVGIAYTASDLSGTSNQVQSASSGSSSAAVIIAIVSILLVLCCCCLCGLVGFVLYRRRKRQQQKESAFLPSGTSMNMSFPPGSAGSTAQLQANPQAFSFAEMNTTQQAMPGKPSYGV